jgi:hypothetical protein
MAATLSEVPTVDVAVPVDLVTKIDSIAIARHVSLERALADLLSDGIAAYEDRRAAFLEIADKFQQSTDPAETDRLRDELVHLTFGD